MTDDPTTAGHLAETGARLRALRQFAQHKGTCARSWVRGSHDPYPNKPCDCGLTALLKELDALLSAPVVSEKDKEMEFDWDAATITVKVPVQHTAVKETQDIIIPLPQFATMLLDLHSRHVRQQMAKQAVERRQTLAAPVVTQEGEEPCP